jgi:hypothetical protein
MPEGDDWLLSQRVIEEDARQRRMVAEQLNAQAEQERHIAELAQFAERERAKSEKAASKPKGRIGKIQGLIDRIGGSD